MFDVANKNKGALLDTNLLVVLMVGMIGEGKIEKFKRTNEYTTNDFCELDKLLASFGWLVTTPTVIAETSNLIAYLKGQDKEKALDNLATYIQKFPEHYTSSKELVATPVFTKFGITDAALLSAAEQEGLELITADLPLYSYALNLGVKCQNFNHKRVKWL